MRRNFMIKGERNNKNLQKEIDFVVNYFDKKIYIQSAYEIKDIEKSSTELDSLSLTKDFYKKIVIRNDIPHSFYDELGFFHCTLLDFLLERVELF